MKRTIQRIVSCLATITITLCMLGSLTKLMERKDSFQKYEDFFSQKVDFDVLFLGTSHVIDGELPMELWNDYGIVSYNLGGHGSQLPTTYWIMRNALDYTSPQVVVIDGFMLSSQVKTSGEFSYVHLSLDDFPLSFTKIRAAWDLLDDSFFNANIDEQRVAEGKEHRSRLGLIWDYSVYHSRWKEITKDDFKPRHLYEKGAESRYAIADGTLTKISSLDKMTPGTVGEEYLRRMIEECQSRGIEVILTYLPFPAPEENQREANYLYDVADEYNIQYINFLDLDVINYETDLYDSDSHLNPSGARKVTDYIGECLKNDYGVLDQRNNEAYRKWHDDYNEYALEKNKTLCGFANLQYYLMLLAGDDVDIRMYIRDKDVFKEKKACELMRNLGIDTAIANAESNLVIINRDRNDFAVEYDSINDEKASDIFSQSVLNDDTSLFIEVLRDDQVFDSVQFVYSYDSGSEQLTTHAANRVSDDEYKEIADY